MSASDRMRLVAGAILFGSLVTCARDAAGPSDAFVLVRMASGEYGVERRRLEVTDLRHLRGPDFAYETADEVKIESTAGDVRVALSGTAPLDLHLVEHDGAWAALDYESLLALSSAHHLERALRHFRSLGLAETTKPTASQRVLFFANRFGGGLPFDNNAFYSSSLGGFAILRENGLNDVPLCANEGVMAHELSHYVFSHLATDALKPFFNEIDPRVLELRSIDEGLADVHAAAVTGDPEFMRASFRTERLDVAAARNLSTARVYTESIWLEALGGFSFNPYLIGSILASAWWSFGERVAEKPGSSREAGRRAMAQVAFDSVTKLGLLSALPETTEGVQRPLLAEIVHGAVEAANDLGHADAFCAVATAQLGPLVRQGDCP